MKSLILWLLIVISLGFGAFAYFDKPDFNFYKDNLLSNIGISNPCASPITYSIGTFDQRFGISKEQFLKDTVKAEKIWEDATEMNLFENSDDGKVKINLIYDYRQAATEKLKSIGLVIDSNKATFDTLKSKYESMLATFKSGKSALETEIAKVNADRDAYEKEVAYWNSRGGAPKDEYQKLDSEKNNINQEIATANQKQTALNDTADTVNSLATVINQLINELNLNVAKYNSTSASTGQEFDEGLYVRDASGEKIDIYQFASEAKLVRVLAHELGHALGLDHVADAKAIMYKQNQSTNIIPTTADIAELNRVCNVKK